MDTTENRGKLAEYDGGPTVIHALTGIACLLAALLARWLWRDDDRPLAHGYPLGSYRPCRPGDCGEYRTAGHRILLTRRVPAWLARTSHN